MTLACWVVWIALALLLGSLIYVATVRELPVPGFVLRRIESRLASANLALKFGAIRFDPTGRVLLEDVSVRSLDFDEPFLSSRQIFVSGSFWSLFAGLSLPDEVRFEGATLQLPAMLSPSGAAQPLVEDIAGTIRLERAVWHIDSLSFRLGAMPVTVHGDVAPPKRTGRPAPQLQELVGRFLSSGRQLALDLDRLDMFEKPILAAEVEASPGIGNTASLLFTARSLKIASPRLPESIILDDLIAGTTVRLEGSSVRPARLQVAASRASAGESASAENIRAIVATSFAPGQHLTIPREVWVTAAGLAGAGESIEAPLVHAEIGAWPEIRLDAAFRAGGDALAAEVEGDLRQRSGTVKFQGSVAPRLLNEVLGRRTPRFAPFLVLGDPVVGEGSAVFSEGAKFERLAVRISAGRIDSRGVKLDKVEGRIDFDGCGFLAHDATLTAGENVARGSYWMDVHSRDFRILLRGRLRPMDIDGWFRRDWWPSLWSNFDFPVAPPAADVDIAGRWGEARLSNNFVLADAQGAVVRGAAFDHVRTQVFVRPGYTDILFAHATRADGRQELEGNVIRRSEADKPGAEYTFDLRSTLDAESLERLSQGAAKVILDDWRFNTPPRVRSSGRWQQTPSGNRFDLAFKGSAVDGPRYLGFPLDSVEVEGDVAGPEIHLKQIAFVAAGGTGRGKAFLDGPPDQRRLGFDMYVKDAELGRTVHAMQEYEAARTGVPVPATEGKFVQRAGAGRLEIAMSAQGKPGLLETFKGTGNAKLTGANLGEVHLFGLLSQVLSGLSLNFSTLKLDTARSSFDLAQGRLQFPDVKVTGESAVIEGKGDYLFADNTVRFTARFKPYESHRNIITGTLGLVINPLTSIIELKLSGPLSDPHWSYSIGQSSEPPPPAGPPPSTQAPPASGVKPPESNSRSPELKDKPASNPDSKTEQ